MWLPLVRFLRRLKNGREQRVWRDYFNDKESMNRTRSDNRRSSGSKRVSNKRNLHPPETTARLAGTEAAIATQAESEQRQRKREKATLMGRLPGKDQREVAENEVAIEKRAHQRRRTPKELRRVREEGGQHQRKLKPSEDNDWIGSEKNSSVSDS